MRQLLLTSFAALTLLLPVHLSQAASPAVGEPAPNFTTTDINGEVFNLEDHKGDIVVLEWTNHQCPFVKKHYVNGDMQKTQKETLEKGVKWVSIVSSGEGRQGHVDAAEAAKVIEEKGFSISAKILDPSGEIGKLYDAKTTPHMFVIDAEGKLAYAGAIDSNSSPNPASIEGADNYVVAAVDNLLAGEAVATPQTQPYGCSVKYKN